MPKKKIKDLTFQDVDKLYNNYKSLETVNEDGEIITVDSKTGEIVCGWNELPKTVQLLYLYSLAIVPTPGLRRSAFTLRFDCDIKPELKSRILNKKIEF